MQSSKTIYYNLIPQPTTYQHYPNALLKLKCLYHIRNLRPVNDIHNIKHASESEVTVEYYFPPVVFRNKNQKDEFKRRVREALMKLPFYYIGEIELRITYYLDENQRYSSLGGDMDNYVKLLSDSIAGVEGIIIDDIQIQSLKVQWINIWDNNPYFEVTIIPLMPDEVINKPIIFLEMPNGYYYPFNSSYENFCSDKLMKMHIKNFSYLLKERMQIQENENKFISKGLDPILPKFKYGRIKRNDFEIMKMNKWIGLIE